MNENFQSNTFVEAQLTEEPTAVYENVITQTMINDCLLFAKDYLKLPEHLRPPYDFWTRRGGIHRTEFIKQLSNTFLKRFVTREDAELIGDTAFAITYPPHDIHVDCRDFRAEPESSKDIISYKSVVLPLEIDSLEFPKFFTTNQYFYGPTTRFRKNMIEVDKVNKESIRQQQNGVFFSYDYEKDGVKYLESNYLSKEWYNDNIDAPDFIPYSTFEGFSIEKEVLWKPANLIVFDSARVHFAQNLRKVGANYKIGLSINYGIRIK